MLSSQEKGSSRRAGALVVLGLLLSSLLAGCGTGSSPPEASVAASPAETGPDSDPVTVRDLERHLSSLRSDGLLGLSTAPYQPGGWPGTYDCSPRGALQAGQAITCEFDPTCLDPDGCIGQWPSGDQMVLVAALDDTGRYTMTYLYQGDAPLYARPDEYPAGTTSCATLAAPPPERHEASGLEHFGLAYPALLHYWSSMGHPSSMDADGNGRPCEEVYATSVVEATYASPLSPRRDPDASTTMEDVRAHAEAVISGFVSPIMLSDCGGDQPATPGATASCAVSTYPDADWQLQLIVFDDSGGYGAAADGAFWHFPTVDDYPAGSACAEFSQPPPGKPTEAEQSRAEDGSWGDETHLMYGDLLFQWYSLGQPADWDTDADGRPCEDVYPPGALHGAPTQLLYP